MEIIEFLQQVDFPAVVLVMKAATFLGDEAFYLLILPVLIWCWKKDIGLPLAVLIYTSFLLNTLLKDAFALPRPPQELHLVGAHGYGFPSGHAQGAMVLWGYFAWRFRVYGRMAAIIFLVGLSRIYLGVHSPADVVGGWSIGFVTLWAGVLALQSLQRRERVFPPVPTALVFVLAGSLVAVFYPDEVVIRVSGFFAGIGAGLVLEKPWVAFEPRAVWWKQGLKVLIGVGGAVLIRTVLKPLLPDLEVMNWLRYGLAGLWVGLGAPWVFKRLSDEIVKSR
jgi:undecaprenyl-diphosphatase